MELMVFMVNSTLLLAMLKYRSLQQERYLEMFVCKSNGNNTNHEFSYCGSNPQYSESVRTVGGMAESMCKIQHFGTPIYRLTQITKSEGLSCVTITCATDSNRKGY